MLVPESWETYTIIKPNDFAIFMRNRDKWGIFSNFFPCEITVGSTGWPSTEHLYQAMKFKDRETRDIIRTCSWVGEAAKLGRTLPGIREDWDQVKQKCMFTALSLKAEQSEKFRFELKSSSDRIIIECSHRDNYWGAKPNNNNTEFKGRNVLGKLLMKVRETA